MMEIAPFAAGPFTSEIFFRQEEALAPFRIVFLRCGKFPLDEARADWLRVCVGKLFDRADADEEVITMLEVNHLPLRSSASTVSANARDWLPMTGLGVIPGEEPPRLWTEDDFMDRDYGTPLRPLMNTVLRLEGSQQAARSAALTMIGSGALSFMTVRDGAEKAVAELSAQYVAEIVEESLLGMPFYLPLLTLTTLKDVTGKALTDWLPQARFYLRECPDGAGILLLSKVAGLFEEAGLWPLPGLAIRGT